MSKGKVLHRAVLRGLWCAVLTLACAVVPAQAVSARSAAVVDGTTGELVYAKNADAVLPMASTTKIMTALVAIELGGLDRVYTVKREYTLAEGSSMYLQEGEELTLLDTLYGLLLMSGNDAALAVAGECGGMEVFVERMNARAAELGLEHTHFDNPSGLDGETHHTTAHELARLASAALENDIFREIVATRSYTSGTRTMVNHNKLLRLYPDAVGVKTGFTKKSGRCLVSAAERNGRRLVAVTLDAPDDWNDHIAMLEDGFARFAPVTLHEAGQTLRRLPVEGGSVDTVGLKAANTVTLWLTEAERAQLTVRCRAPRFAYAPVFTGRVAGAVCYEIGGVPLAQDALCWDASAAQLPARRTAAEKLIDRLRTLLGR